jgi:hypothetical protein
LEIKRFPALQDTTFFPWTTPEQQCGSRVNRRRRPEKGVAGRWSGCRIVMASASDAIHGAQMQKAGKRLDLRRKCSSQ